MMLARQYEKVWAKLDQMERTYEDLIFTRVRTVAMEYLVCREHHRTAPAQGYSPARSGMRWGGSGLSGWFRGAFVVDEELARRPLYLDADTGAIEAMLFVGEMPMGIYAHKIVENNRGNHHMLRLTAGTEPGQELQFSIEGYCWHNGVGTQPFAIPDTGDKSAVYNGVWVCIEEDAVKDFVFDLRILNQLRKHVKDDFRRAEVEKCLWDVYCTVPQKPLECPAAEWKQAVVQAVARMEPVIRTPNGPQAPSAGLIGHSHMDTAWQWTIEETIRKCARTYSNALNLMEQYPDYLFFQSSAYHGELMKQHYPALFAEMRRRVAEGRYEPNGGVWIECDCNLAGGEALVRQFLWGQTWTRDNYGYRSDVFWLPDTFGYSAALPQILLGAGIRYFLTTKLIWNETNPFPYDTFRWRGIDGSTVLAHFNDTNGKPEPAHLIENVYGRTQCKMVNNDRLIAYGFGDGGGGPSYDLVEMASRVKDVNGCPRTRHTTVSAFMQKLEKECEILPEYTGELYLEAHRGTLTTRHEIKRGNRKAEIALHDLDLAASMAWLAGRPIPSYRDCYEKLLINQFHDILPGTAIPEVHDRAIRELGEVRTRADALLEQLLGVSGSDKLSLVNTLPWERHWAWLETEAPALEGVCTQAGIGPDGRRRLYLSGLRVPAQGKQTLQPSRKESPAAPAFAYMGDTVESPWHRITFDEDGYITSFLDKRANRELVRRGGDGFNVLYLTEDVPQIWDNWDIDADVLEKMRPVRGCCTRTLLENGPLFCRVRSIFRLTEKTTLTQDMILYTNRPQVDFETRVDWHETHRLLKTGFDMAVHAAYARHEIQFGYLERPCYKNTSWEKAMFEVVNHKYTDFSEPGYGVALLNDGKYGISVEGSRAALSLIKSGTHPDPRGDEGVHDFTYSLLTHSGFGWENVIRPAYELNYPLRPVAGESELVHPILECDRKNVIPETVKPAEDGSGIIVRVYESEGTGGPVTICLQAPARRVLRTNLLEEETGELALAEGKIQLQISPFEILTLKLIF